MPQGLQLFPQQASTIAKHVDWLYFFLIAVTIFFATLVCVLVTFFMIRYRRGTKVDRSNPVNHSTTLELLWTGIPLVLAMVIFAWGAVLFYAIQTPGQGAMEIYVVGKQWMWKLQHPAGKKEINELHVPLGKRVRLTMTSEDVIHSFYVPAFRIKKDVLPGRYTTLWFEATKLGTFHLFCAEYCGLGHSRMIGRVVVMTPGDYEKWLSGGGNEEPLEVSGERLFQRLACATCHREDSKGRGPTLAGVFGTSVRLKSGASVVADESYIRESILEPQAKLTAGFDPVMPTFIGQLGEEGIIQLIAYIKSLARKPDSSAPPTPPTSH